MDGIARIQHYTGLVQELTLAQAALTYLGLNLCPRPDGTFTPGHAVFNDQAQVRAPWDLTSLVGADVFFREVSARKFAGKRSLVINELSRPFYADLNSKLKKLEVNDAACEKRTVNRMKVLRGILSAFFGNIWEGNRGFVVDTSELQFRTMLLKGWAQREVALELPARVATLSEQLGGE